MAVKRMNAKERQAEARKAWARRVVDASPPLTAGQLEELAVLLQPTSDYRAAMSPVDQNVST
jgi:hypothetical protein